MRSGLELPRGILTVERVVENHDAFSQVRALLCLGDEEGKGQTGFVAGAQDRAEARLRRLSGLSHLQNVAVHIDAVLGIRISADIARLGLAEPKIGAESFEKLIDTALIGLGGRLDVGGQSLLSFCPLSC